MNPLQLPQSALSPIFGIPLGGAAPAARQVATEMATQPDGYVETDPRHTGVAGVARDIFGTLGDFLLTRLRMPAMYGPAQQRRREASATADFDSDPLAAIRRLESINPEAGRELRNQYLDNQRLEATRESTTEARDARLALQREMQSERNRNTAASMLGALARVPEQDRAANYSRARQAIIGRYGRADPQLSQDLPEEYDSVVVDAFIDGAVPMGTQRAQRLTADRVEETGRSNRERETISAERLRETERSNKAREALSAERNRSRGSGRAAPRVTNVQTYTDENNRRVTVRSDGTVITSPTRVRQTGRPADGTRRVVNGVAYVIRNGVPVRE